jgi:hypothetical protein
VVDAFHIHRHKFATDQFETLILIDDPSSRRRLDLGHGPAPPHQALGSLRGG